jgi:hypothetical protein
MISCAGLFLLALFFVKNGLPWKSTEVYQGAGGLSYEKALVGDIVKRDTDGDGVLDWEESLWNLDPTKPETTAGTPDITVVNKLRAEGGEGTPDTGNADGDSEEKLTETDKFSRELFSTVAALEQGGSLDQSTAEKIVNSLAENIENSTQRKVFYLSDIKIIKEDSAQAIEKYLADFDHIQSKYPVKNTVLEVLQKFIVDDSTTDASALKELGPLAGQMNKTIGEMANMSVPQFLASFHLDYINALQKLTENIEDMQFYETDAMIFFSGINQYEKNSALLESAGNNLVNAIAEKLDI